MSKFKFYFLIPTFIIVFFSSCRVEKRIYSSGYYIEWNNGKRGVFNKEIVKDNNRKSETLEQSNTIYYDTINLAIINYKSTIESVSDEQIILYENKSNILVSIEKEWINNQEIITSPSFNRTNSQIKIDPSIKNPEKNQKTNRLGLISFISVLILIISFFTTLKLFLLVLLPSLFSSLLLGAIALRQFKRNPEKYKGKFMAQCGVLIGYLGCTIGLLFSLWGVVLGGVIYLILGTVFLTNIIVSTYILLND
jgi:hypothetical protein